MWSYDEIENDWLSSPPAAPAAEETAWPGLADIEFHTRNAQRMRSEAFLGILTLTFRSIGRTIRSAGRTAAAQPLNPPGKNAT